MVSYKQAQQQAITSSMSKHVTYVSKCLCSLFLWPKAFSTLWYNVLINIQQLNCLFVLYTEDVYFNLENKYKSISCQASWYCLIILKMSIFNSTYAIKNPIKVIHHCMNIAQYYNILFSLFMVLLITFVIHTFNCTHCPLCSLKNDSLFPANCPCSHLKIAPLGNLSIASTLETSWCALWYFCNSLGSC